MRKYHAIPRLPEFKMANFCSHDFQTSMMKRIILFYDGEVILDLIRPDEKVTNSKTEAICWDVVESNISIPQQYQKGKYVRNGLISGALNVLGEVFPQILIELIVTDNVGNSADMYYTRVLRYLITYHGKLYDCECISDPRRLETFGDVVEIRGNSA